jgi:hypothetical protein
MVMPLHLHGGPYFDRTAVIRSNPVATLPGRI